MIYLLVCFFLIAIITTYLHRHTFLIYRWKRTLHLSQHQLHFKKLYQNVCGFILSKQAREKGDAFEYVYGEIEFIPFIALLSLVNPDEKTIFYDLGCGTGKAVIAAAMVYPIQKSVGIELFPELYHCACEQRKQLATTANYLTAANNIEFILADFLTVDLNPATLIFINSTGFIGDTWKTLCKRLDTLPQLETVITTSKPLASDVFTPIKVSKTLMSWGVVLSYIHVRKHKKY